MIALALSELATRRRLLIGVTLGCVALFAVLGTTYASLGVSQLRVLANAKAGTNVIAAFSGSSRGDIFRPLGYLAFGFNHPLFLVLTLTVAIAIGSASIAGDVESGRAQLLYTRPVARRAIFFAHVGGWLVAQVLVVTVAFGGAATFAQIAPAIRDAGPLALWRVVIQYLPLTWFVGAVAFLASALAHARGRAAGGAIAVAVTSYLTNLTALLWHPVAWLRRVTPFGYYEPINAVRGVHWGAAGLLTGGAAVLLAVAAVVIERRDLV